MTINKLTELITRRLLPKPGEAMTISGTSADELYFRLIDLDVFKINPETEPGKDVMRATFDDYPNVEVLITMVRAPGDGDLYREVISVSEPTIATHER